MFLCEVKLVTFVTAGLKSIAHALFDFLFLLVYRNFLFCLLTGMLVIKYVVLIV